MWLDQVLLDIRHQVSCVVGNICEAAVGDPRGKVFDKRRRITVAVEEEALSFPDEEENLRRRTHE